MQFEPAKTKLEPRRMALEDRLREVRGALAVLERDTEGGLAETKLAIDELRAEEMSLTSQLDALWIARMTVMSMPEPVLAVQDTERGVQAGPGWFSGLFRNKTTA